MESAEGCCALITPTLHPRCNSSATTARVPVHPSRWPCQLRDPSSLWVPSIWLPRRARSGGTCLLAQPPRQHLQCPSRPPARAGVPWAVRLATVPRRGHQLAGKSDATALPQGATAWPRVSSAPTRHRRGRGATEALSKPGRCRHGEQGTRMAGPDVSSGHLEQGPNG